MQRVEEIGESKETIKEPDEAGLTVTTDTVEELEISTYIQPSTTKSENVETDRSIPADTDSQSNEVDSIKATKEGDKETTAHVKEIDSTVEKQVTDALVTTETIIGTEYEMSASVQTAQKQENICEPTETPECLKTSSKEDLLITSIPEVIHDVEISIKLSNTEMLATDASDTSHSEENKLAADSSKDIDDLKKEFDVQPQSSGDKQDIMTTINDLTVVSEEEIKEAKLSTSSEGEAVLKSLEETGDKTVKIKGKAVTKSTDVMTLSGDIETIEAITEKDQQKESDVVVAPSDTASAKRPLSEETKDAKGDKVETIKIVAASAQDMQRADEFGESKETIKEPDQSGLTVTKDTAEELEISTYIQPSTTPEVITVQTEAHAQQEIDNELDSEAKQPDRIIPKGETGRVGLEIEKYPSILSDSVTTTSQDKTAIVIEPTAEIPEETLDDETATGKESAPLPTVCTEEFQNKETTQEVPPDQITLEMNVTEVVASISPPVPVELQSGQDELCTDVPIKIHQPTDLNGHTQDKPKRAPPGDTFDEATSQDVGKPLFQRLKEKTKEFFSSKSENVETDRSIPADTDSQSNEVDSIKATKEGDKETTAHVKEIDSTVEKQVTDALVTTETIIGTEYEMSASVQTAQKQENIFEPTETPECLKTSSKEDLLITSIPEVIHDVEISIKLSNTEMLATDASDTSHSEENKLAADSSKDFDDLKKEFDVQPQSSGDKQDIMTTINDLTVVSEEEIKEAKLSTSSEGEAVLKSLEETGDKTVKIKGKAVTKSTDVMTLSGDIETIEAITEKDQQKESDVVVAPSDTASAKRPLSEETKDAKGDKVETIKIVAASAQDMQRAEEIGESKETIKEPDQSGLTVTKDTAEELEISTYIQPSTTPEVITVQTEAHAQQEIDNELDSEAKQPDRIIPKGETGRVGLENEKYPSILSDSVTTTSQDKTAIVIEPTAEIPEETLDDETATGKENAPLPTVCTEKFQNKETTQEVPPDQSTLEMNVTEVVASISPPVPVELQSGQDELCTDVPIKIDQPTDLNGHTQDKPKRAPPGDTFDEATSQDVGKPLFQRLKKKTKEFFSSKSENVETDRSIPADTDSQSNEVDSIKATKEGDKETTAHVKEIESTVEKQVTDALVTTEKIIGTEYEMSASVQTAQKQENICEPTETPECLKTSSKEALLITSIPEVIHDVEISIKLSNTEMLATDASDTSHSEENKLAADSSKDFDDLKKEFDVQPQSSGDKQDILTTINDLTVVSEEEIKEAKLSTSSEGEAVLKSLEETGDKTVKIKDKAVTKSTDVITLSGDIETIEAITEKDQQKESDVVIAPSDTASAKRPLSEETKDAQGDKGETTKIIVASAQDKQRVEEIGESKENTQEPEAIAFSVRINIIKPLEKSAGIQTTDVRKVTLELNVLSADEKINDAESSDIEHGALIMLDSKKSLTGDSFTLSITSSDKPTETKEVPTIATSEKTVLDTDTTKTNEPQHVTSALEVCDERLTQPESDTPKSPPEINEVEVVTSLLPPSTDNMYAAVEKTSKDRAHKLQNTSLESVASVESEQTEADSTPFVEGQLQKERTKSVIDIMIEKAQGILTDKSDSEEEDAVFPEAEVQHYETDTSETTSGMSAESIIETTRDVHGNVEEKIVINGEVVSELTSHGQEISVDIMLTAHPDNVPQPIVHSEEVTSTLPSISDEMQADIDKMCTDESSMHKIHSKEVLFSVEKKNTNPDTTEGLDDAPYHRKRKKSIIDIIIEKAKDIIHRPSESEVIESVSQEEIESKDKKVDTLDTTSDHTLELHVKTTQHVNVTADEELDHASDVMCSNVKAVSTTTCPESTPVLSETSAVKELNDEEHTNIAHFSWTVPEVEIGMIKSDVKKSSADKSVPFNAISSVESSVEKEEFFTVTSQNTISDTDTTKISDSRCSTSDLEVRSERVTQPESETLKCPPEVSEAEAVASLLPPSTDKSNSDLDKTCKDIATKVEKTTLELLASVEAEKIEADAAEFVDEKLNEKSKTSFVDITIEKAKGMFTDKSDSDEEDLGFPEETEVQDYETDTSETTSGSSAESEKVITDVVVSKLKSEGQGIAVDDELITDDVNEAAASILLVSSGEIHADLDIACTDESSRQIETSRTLVSSAENRNTHSDTTEGLHDQPSHRERKKSIIDIVIEKAKGIITGPSESGVTEATSQKQITSEDKKVDTPDGTSHDTLEVHATTIQLVHAIADDEMIHASHVTTVNMNAVSTTTHPESTVIPSDTSTVEETNDDKRSEITRTSWNIPEVEFGIVIADTKKSSDAERVTLTTISLDKSAVTKGPCLATASDTDATKISEAPCLTSELVNEIDPVARPEETVHDTTTAKEETEAQTLISPLEVNAAEDRESISPAATDEMDANLFDMYVDETTKLVNVSCESVVSAETKKNRMNTRERVYEEPHRKERSKSLIDIAIERAKDMFAGPTNREEYASVSQKEIEDGDDVTDTFDTASDVTAESDQETIHREVLLSKESAETIDATVSNFQADKVEGAVENEKPTSEINTAPILTSQEVEKNNEEFPEAKTVSESIAVDIAGIVIAEPTTPGGESIIVTTTSSGSVPVLKGEAHVAQSAQILSDAHIMKGFVPQNRTFTMEVHHKEMKEMDDQEESDAVSTLNKDKEEKLEEELKVKLHQSEPTSTKMHEALPTTTKPITNISTSSALDVTSAPRATETPTKEQGLPTHIPRDNPEESSTTVTRVYVDNTCIEEEVYIVTFISTICKSSADALTSEEETSRDSQKSTLYDVSILQPIETPIETFENQQTFSTMSEQPKHDQPNVLEDNVFLAHDQPQKTIDGSTFGGGKPEADRNQSNPSSSTEECMAYLKNTLSPTGSEVQITIVNKEDVDIIYIRPARKSVSVESLEVTNEVHQSASGKDCLAHLSSATEGVTHEATEASSTHTQKQGTKNSLTETGTTTTEGPFIVTTASTEETMAFALRPKETPHDTYPITETVMHDWEEVTTCKDDHRVVDPVGEVKEPSLTTATSTLVTAPLKFYRKETFSDGATKHRDGSEFCAKVTNELREEECIKEPPFKQEEAIEKAEELISGSNFALTQEETSKLLSETEEQSDSGKVTEKHTLQETLSIVTDKECNDDDEESFYANTAPASVQYQIQEHDKSTIQLPPDQSTSQGDAQTTFIGRIIQTAKSLLTGKSESDQEDTSNPQLTTEIHADTGDASVSISENEKESTCGKDTAESKITADAADTFAEEYGTGRGLPWNITQHVSFAATETTDLNKLLDQAQFINVNDELAYRNDKHDISSITGQGELNELALTDAPSGESITDETTEVRVGDETIQDHADVMKRRLISCTGDETQISFVYIGDTEIMYIKPARKDSAACLVDEGYEVASGKDPEASTQYFYQHQQFGMMEPHVHIESSDKGSPTSTAAVSDSSCVDTWVHAFKELEAELEDSKSKAEADDFTFWREESFVQPTSTDELPLTELNITALTTESAEMKNEPELQSSIPHTTFNKIHLYYPKSNTEHTEEEREIETLSAAIASTACEEGIITSEELLKRSKASIKPDIILVHTAKSGIGHQEASIHTTALAAKEDTKDESDLVNADLLRIETKLAADSSEGNTAYAAETGFDAPIEEGHSSASTADTIDFPPAKLNELEIDGTNVEATTRTAASVQVDTLLKSTVTAESPPDHHNTCKDATTDSEECPTDFVDEQLQEVDINKTSFINRTIQKLKDIFTGMPVNEETQLTREEHLEANTGELETTNRVKESPHSKFQVEAGDTRDLEKEVKQTEELHAGAHSSPDQDVNVVTDYITDEGITVGGSKRSTTDHFIIQRSERVNPFNDMSISLSDRAVTITVAPRDAAANVLEEQDNAPSDISLKDATTGESAKATHSESDEEFHDCLTVLEEFPMPVTSKDAVEHPKRSESVFSDKVPPHHLEAYTQIKTTPEENLVKGPETSTNILSTVDAENLKISEAPQFTPELRDEDFSHDINTSEAVHQSDTSIILSDAEQVIKRPSVEIHASGLDRTFFIESNVSKGKFSISEKIVNESEAGLSDSSDRANQIARDLDKSCTTTEQMISTETKANTYDTTAPRGETPKTTRKQSFIQSLQGLLPFGDKTAEKLDNATSTDGGEPGQVACEAAENCTEETSHPALTDNAQHPTNEPPLHPSHAEAVKLPKATAADTDKVTSEDVAPKSYVTADEQGSETHKASQTYSRHLTASIICECMIQPEITTTSKHDMQTQKATEITQSCSVTKQGRATATDEYGQATISPSSQLLSIKEVGHQVKDHLFRLMNQSPGKHQVDFASSEIENVVDSCALALKVLAPDAQQERHVSSITQTLIRHSSLGTLTATAEAVSLLKKHPTDPAVGAAVSVLAVCTAVGEALNLFSIKTTGEALAQCSCSSLPAEAMSEELRVVVHGLLHDDGSGRRPPGTVATLRRAALGVAVTLSAYAVHLQAPSDEQTGSIAVFIRQLWNAEQRGRAGRTCASTSPEVSPQPLAPSTQPRETSTTQLPAISTQTAAALPALSVETCTLLERLLSSRGPLASILGSVAAAVLMATRLAEEGDPTLVDEMVRHMACGCCHHAFDTVARLVP
uniref:Titin-like isoform X4 n=1 Tax=Petromyzon marinus TaxID=7757 RepID=A0AAJ7X8E4_PETMA|nr:titin-like isoform X4 [Petromyzon marinus]